jgi:membrane-associated phospholipid phosphatase
MAVALVIAAPGSARAQGELEWRPVIDGGIVVGGGLLWVASETALKGGLAPDTCRWCDDNALDRGWREALKWDDTGLAGDLSSIVGFGVMPASALGLGAVAAGYDGRFSQWPVDAVLVLESMVIASDLDQLVKFGAGRERPFVHALPEDQKPLTADPQDNNLSFYSGHTTFAFSLAVASGTVASLRHYRLEPLIWVVGLTAATATGWLRMAADKHYFTDVAVGALSGAAIGFAVPYLHRAHRAPPIAPVPMQGGMGLAWSGRW